MGLIRKVSKSRSWNSRRNIVYMYIEVASISHGPRPPVRRLHSVVTYRVGADVRASLQRPGSLNIRSIVK